MIQVFFLFIVVFIQSGVFGESSAEPMQQTQDLLKNKQQRQKAIKELPESAKQADQNVDEIVGGDEGAKEDMYNVSSDIFKNFEGKSPEEMQKILEEAQKNPEKFYQSLSNEQKEKIKAISSKLEKNKKTKP